MSDSNPFATRFVRPGAIGYLFPAGQSAQSLVADLQSHGWWGEIVGPHGSGKSTLLAALAPALAASGRELRRVCVSVEPATTLRDAGVEAVAPARAYRALAAGAIHSATQLAIDGYEQLSWWSRWQVRSLCKRRGAGLLVTAHRPMGLPPLFRTQPTAALARQVVARLVDASDKTIAPADIERAFEQTAGNLRETLFALYDVYQSRR